MDNPAHSPEELQAMFDDMKRVFSEGLERLRKSSPEHYDEVQKNLQEMLDNFQQQYPSVK